eukprot:TRINITY_DN1920_c0_g1_i1.p1 TRINITY_DN1920_c0_g1~~TRINITY_DN1920_c0_g1_i1.p1  ORF type:complete len:163 (+),score=26.38 TRINITY_DN1920_c0_g1_i1:171-659(+)
MASIKDILNDKEKLKKITKAAFDAVDTDKSGFLERNELEAIMLNVAKDIGVDNPSKDEVDEVLKEIDANSDGKISITEFEVLIRQVLEIMVKAEEQSKQYVSMPIQCMSTSLSIYISLSFTYVLMSHHPIYLQSPFKHTACFFLDIRTSVPAMDKIFRWIDI